MERPIVADGKKYGTSHLRYAVFLNILFLHQFRKALRAQCVEVTRADLSVLLTRQYHRASAWQIAPEAAHAV